jgi:hypothetical protein
LNRGGSIPPRITPPIMKKKIQAKPVHAQNTMDFLNIGSFSIDFITTFLVIDFPAKQMSRLNPTRN